MLLRIRWSGVRFFIDLRVCQEMMRVWGSIRLLFYPQPYVYMKLCQQTEQRNLEELSRCGGGEWVGFFEKKIFWELGASLLSVRSLSLGSL